VNGQGISGAEVVLDGNNIVITVPGEGGDKAKELGQTATLGFRKVLDSQPNQPAPRRPTRPAAGQRFPAAARFPAAVLAGTVFAEAIRRRTVR